MSCWVGEVWIVKRGAEGMAGGRGVVPILVVVGGTKMVFCRKWLSFACGGWLEKVQKL